MKRLWKVGLLAAVGVSTPAAANHVRYLNVPFETRGACESFSAQLSAGDREALQVAFPDLLSTSGDVESFLTRAFTCEQDDFDGQWYITDYRRDVINSDWFQRRLDH